MSLLKRIAVVLLMLALPLQGLAARAMTMPCERHGVPAAAELPPCHEAAAAPSEDEDAGCPACVFCAMSCTAYALPAMAPGAPGASAHSPLVAAVPLPPQAGFARGLERPPRG